MLLGQLGKGHALVAGDAGMGKTRLLTELAEHARGEGWQVMVGHCLDFADQLLPYLPFSELVGRLVDEAPELAEQVVARHPALAALAPGRRLMSAPSTEPIDASGQPRVDRAAIFDAVHAMLETRAEDGRVLVVIEDLHWADQSTRDLLRFLFARPFRGSVTIVGSYRSDDLHRRHPLRAAVAEWARLPGMVRMQLAPLADEEVRRLVRTLHPAPMRERDLAWVVTRAEGNAFFVEELVGATGTGDGLLPEDLVDLLLVRLERLDDAGRQVVRAASCAGRRVNHALLAAVVMLPADELDRGLRSAVESHVLVQVGADGYAFRHALLAEAVYRDLLPGERVRLHARYVDALTTATVTGAAAELATHARAALDTDTAIRAGVRAGEEAMAVGGPDDAAKHFEAVLELAAGPTTALPEGVDLVELVSLTKEAVIASGHPGRAKALVRDHLDQAELTPRGRARLLVAWTGAALLEDSEGEPTRATEEALVLIGEEPGRLRTRTLSMHARALMFEGRDDEAAKHAGEALAMAQRFEMTDVVAEAATTLASLDDRLGDPETALRALEEVVVSAHVAGDVKAEMRGRHHLAYILLDRGRLAEAHDLFEQSRAAAVAMGQPWAPYGFDARYHQAMTAYLRGMWDDTLAMTDVAGQSPPPDHEATLMGVRMLVASGRGDESALVQYDELKPSWPREGLIANNAGAAAIDLHGQRGDLDAVWRVHDEVVSAVSQIWSPLYQARVRLSALVLGQVASAVGALARHGRPPQLARASELLDVVGTIYARATARPRGFGPEGQAWAARARAEHLRLRWSAGIDVPVEAELVAPWEETARLFEELGHRYETARSRARLAAVLLACGRSADAAPLVAQARATAEELGARPLLDELAALGGRSPAAERSDTDLTPRETEILQLVAEGRSNGEIGKRLFISTKTVSVHVSNILAKLGAAGRTEAAAIARRKGLLGD